MYYINKMSHFVYEDRIGKLCSIYDLKYIQTVYGHLDFSSMGDTGTSLDPEMILEWTKKQIETISNDRKKFESSEQFRDKETKDFLVNQSNNILLHLKRLKSFLTEGIDKGHRLTLDT